jgi:hypothetical protein
MKKYLKMLLILIATALFFACACNVEGDNSSLKSLSKPYVNTYECVTATLGETNLLDGFEYITITLKDDDTLELNYKKIGESNKCFSGSYSYNQTDGALSSSMAIFGTNFSSTTTIKDGGFTLSFPILNRQLVMKFCVK